MTVYKKWDHHYREAKKQGYAARSVFKLKALNEKHKLIRPDSWVLDLGCSPGSWSQYVSEILGPKGRLVGVDIEPLGAAIPALTFHLGSFDEAPWETLLAPRGKVDVVLSDMAPRTTGIRETDQARSLELSEGALELALRFLAPHGNFLCKIFESPDTKAWEMQLKKHFSHVTRERPEAVRKASFELYFLCLGRKP